MARKRITTTSWNYNSIRVKSDEEMQVEGLTVTNKDGIGNTGDGFQYGIFGIVFEPEEDYNSIVESFFALAKKIRRGGAILVPERTYWHLPCGRESVEILCEAAGFNIEAPLNNRQRYVYADKL